MTNQMMDYHLNGKTQLAEGACFWRHRPEPGGDTMSYYLESLIMLPSITSM